MLTIKGLFILIAVLAIVIGIASFIIVIRDKH